MMGGASVHGLYYDPKHGACVRTVTPLPHHTNVYLVTGAYGEKEAGPSGTSWHAHMRVDNKFLTVDFYDKRTTHERVYHALWCPTLREIHWEDGNVWKKLYSGYDAC